MIGVAIPARCLSNDTDKRMVLKHFNSITAENEMKPESLLAGQTSTGLSYRFSTADAFVDFASTNKIGIRGHTLVWHNQTPDWFFKDSNGQRLSKDALLARLKQYIYDVVGRYKGKCMHGTLSMKLSMRISQIVIDVRHGMKFVVLSTLKKHLYGLMKQTLTQSYSTMTIIPRFLRKEILYTTW